MLDQPFTTQNILKLVTYEDFIKYPILKNESDRIREVEKVVSIISDADFKLSNLNIKKEKSLLYTPSNINDDFALRKLNDVLKRIYKVKQSDRNSIIFQITSLLNEEVPMSIIRLDVKKFYESIDRDSVLSKIKSDNIIPYKLRLLIEQLFQLPEIKDVIGLQRGLGISATLSELYMRDFDKRVKQLDTVYYYARYVDDIIIFSFSNPQQIREEVSKVLPYGLIFNNAIEKNKTIERTKCLCLPICTCSASPCVCKDKCKCKNRPKSIDYFEYLGYRFSFNLFSKDSESVALGLANSKIKKIKSRIVYSFLDYFKNENFALLEKRIQFLTGNYIIKKDKFGNRLNAGIYYNYPMLTLQEDLENLTLFLRKNINAKNGAYGEKMSVWLSPVQRKRLSKYSFVEGSKSKILYDFTYSMISKIKECWRYE